MKKAGPALLMSAVLLLTGCAGAGIGLPSGAASNTSDNISAESADPSAAGDVPSASADLYAMDTYMTVTCCGDRCEEALEASADEINRIDELLSVGNENSIVSQLNVEGSGVLDEDTGIIVEKALEVYGTTGGLFDITVYPLMNLWGFTSDYRTSDFHVPSQKELDKTLNLVGSDQIIYDPGTGSITLGEGQGIDLGGIAKGFTSDRLMEIFAQYDLVGGVVSLGGNAQVYRSKTDGSAWKCGIRDPFGESSSIMAVLEIKDKAVITSGAYERYYVVDEETGEVTSALDYADILDAKGTIYHHIINPNTGYPGNSGIVSASIVSESGLLADALSTSAYLMGLDGTINYWQEYGDDFDFILMTEDQEVYISEGIENSFSTDYPLTVVKREK